MKIYLNTANNQVIESYDFNAPVNSLSFKRGDFEQLQVQFVSDNRILTPVIGRTIIFGCKPLGDYDGTDFTIYASTSTVVLSSYYLLNTSFNTTAINSVLSGDTPSVTLHGEFTFSDNGTDWETSNLLTIVVYNDVIRNTENTPIGSPTPEQWLAQYGLTPLVLSSPPLSSVLATVTVNPTVSANDTVKYTHKAGGTAGNFFYTSYSPGTDTVIPAFQYDGTTGITVKYAPRAYLTVTGAGDAAYNTIYRYDSEENGKPMWVNEDVTYIRIAYTLDYEWGIYNEGNELQYKTNNAPAWPELGTWIAVDGTAPAPTSIVKHNSTAADLVSYLGNYPTVSSVITAELVGDGSGYVGTVGLSAFTGGVNGTTGVLGQDAIVNHADVWTCVQTLPYKWVKVSN